MPDKVTIEKLTVSAFRNYAEASLRLDGRHVVLTGENGSGKTNLLEAISFLSPGRGLRRASYADVVKQGSEQGFSIFAQLDGMEGAVSIGTGVSVGEETMTRRVRINGTDAKSADELLDHLRILWLTPAMDGLFTGPASDRRRFVDRLVLSLDPAHGKRAADFDKAMKMRNRLLEAGRYDEDWLGSIESQMASLGIAMMLARKELVQLLSEAVASVPDSPFPEAVLDLSGFLEAEALLPAIDLEDRYRETLGQSRLRDQAAGRTLEGPHRSDLVVRHRQKQIEAALCSTGEQKGLLTGLVLAHAQLTANLTGFTPILLLDEIGAHFDPVRRAALFDRIDHIGCQAFMTGTDPHLFEALGARAQHFDVNRGTIVPSRN